MSKLIECSNNLAIGIDAMKNLEVGKNNVALGKDAMPDTIGNDMLVYGNFVNGEEYLRIELDGTIFIRGEKKFQTSPEFSILIRNMCKQIYQEVALYLENK